MCVGSGMVRGMLVFAINEKTETVGDGVPDVPPENAQHFSVNLWKLPLRGRVVEDADPYSRGNIRPDIS